MLLLRGAFWLVVLTLFLPPENRPIPFIQFKLPHHLGDGSRSHSKASIPDNHYCAEHKNVCEDVADTLDTITAIGLEGLGHIRWALDSKFERDGDGKAEYLRHLIDS